MKDAEIDRIAEAALKLPLIQRAAYIAEACDHDSGAIEDVIAFLSKPIWPGSSGQAPFGDDLNGGQVGRYTLLERIGEGGSGIVYKARRDDGGEFALKLLRPEYRSTDSIVARFLAEQKTLQQMHHANIAAFVDAGQFQGRPYLVVELISDAEPITVYCRRNRLSLRERLKLFGEVCEAVAHAHRNGLIHRDLKPTNILVTVSKTSGRAVPKLIDFGIAKALEPEFHDASYTTQGHFVGTLAYASPEQIQGLGSDTRSDVYALGLILWELLAGVPAVTLDRALEVDAMRRLVCTEPISKPSEVATSGIPYVIPSELDWIVLKATEKAQSRRYSSVEALLEDLVRFGLGKQVQAHPGSMLYNFYGFVREHKVISLLVMLLLAVCAAAVHFGVKANWAERTASQRLIQLKEEMQATETALKRAQRAESRASANLATTTRINEAVAVMLSAPEAAVAAEIHISHKDHLRRTSKELGGRLEGEPDVEAPIRMMLGRAFLEYREPAQAAIEFLRAKMLFEQQEPKVLTDVLTAQHSHLVALHRSGNAKAAFPFARKLLQQTESALGKDAELTIQAKILAADLYREVRQFRECLEILESISYQGPPEHWSAAQHWAKLHLAIFLRDQGRKGEAFDILQVLLRGQREKFGHSAHITLTTQQNLALLHLANQEDDVSADLMLDGLAKIERTSPDSLLAVRIRRDLAGVLNRLGRVHESEQLYLQSIFQEQGFNGSEQPGNPDTLMHYSKLLRNRGDFNQSQRVMEFVLNQADSKFGTMHLATSPYLETMGSIFEDQGRYLEELYWKTRLLVCYVSGYGLDHEATIATAKKTGETFAITFVDSICFRGCSLLECVTHKSQYFAQFGTAKSIPMVVNADGLKLTWTHP